MKMIWKICEFSFIIVQQVSLHSLIGPRRFVRCHQFCWNNHSFWIVLSNRFPCTFRTTRDSASQLIARVRYCSVDTELIDGDDRAKNHFKGFVVATEVYRQFLLSFAFQISSFQSTGSTEYGVSTYTEVEHHVFSDTIPFSIRLVRLCSAPLLS